VAEAIGVFMKKTKGFTVKEQKPGHITITCDISGKPFSRSNEKGMFCGNGKNECPCEQNSMTKEEFEKILGDWGVF